jgi:glycosyltransferase involved in cell wall biosynthesis
LAGLLGRQGGLRMIAQYHNQYDDKWTEGSYALGLERHLAQTTDAMIAVSGAVRDHVAARLLVDPGRVDVVLNGIDPDKVRDCDRDAARQALGLRADDLAIGCVGRVCRQKGQDLFVQAALALLHRMPRAQFLIIGSPEDAAMTDALTRQIADAGAADRIRFLGHRPDIAPIYRALDVLAAPSRWEGFGLMLAEAMAAGCAVVASAVGAIPEVTAGAAVLVPPDDPDALAEALAGLGGQEQQAMQAKGMIRARAFGWEQAAAEVAAIYDRVLA